MNLFYSLIGPTVLPAFCVETSAYNIIKFWFSLSDTINTPGMSQHPGNHSSCNEDDGLDYQNADANAKMVVEKKIINIIDQYQLGGVHNITHHHSFQHSSGLVPSTCEVCCQYILPFIGSPLYCLRCNHTVHQKCLPTLQIQATAVAAASGGHSPIYSCPNFHAHILPGAGLQNQTKYSHGYGKKSTVASVISMGSPASSSSASVIPGQQSAESLAGTRQHVIESANKIVSHLKHIPAVGTRYCLWRYVSKQLVDHASDSALSAIIKYNDFEIDDLEEIIQRPSEVKERDSVGECEDVQDSPETLKHKQDVERLRIHQLLILRRNHMRELVSRHLRTLFGLNVGEPAISSHHVLFLVFHTCHELFRSLSFPTIADTLVHGRECIDTVISAVLTLCDEETVLSNEELVSCIMEAVEYEMLSYQGSTMYDKLMMSIFAITQRFSPLALPLQQASKDESSAEEEILLDRVATICQDIPVQLSPKRKVAILVQAMREIALSGKVDTDQLILQLAKVIAKHSQDHLVNWMAECIFLSSAFISPQIVDLNGAEGYAIITLQQCLQYLLTPSP